MSEDSNKVDPLALYRRAVRAEAKARALVEEMKGHPVERDLLRITIEQENERVLRLDAELVQVRHELTQLMQSTSWRFTRPLRNAATVLRALKARIQ